MDVPDSDSPDVGDASSVESLDAVRDDIWKADSSFGARCVEGADTEEVELEATEGLLVGCNVDDADVEWVSEMVLPPTCELRRQLVSDPDSTVKGDDEAEVSFPSMTVIVNWVPPGQVIVRRTFVELVLVKTVPWPSSITTS